MYLKPVNKGGSQSDLYTQGASFEGPPSNTVSEGLDES
jgi:hypothetical protein